MPWTVPTRRHLGAKMVLPFDEPKRLLMAMNGSQRHAAGTSALPPTTDMKNGDIQCTGFVNVFASFSRRIDHGRLILYPLVVVEPGQSRGAEMDSHRMLR